MNTKILLLTSVFLLSGCATGMNIASLAGFDSTQPPTVQGPITLNSEENRLLPPKNGALTVAVYSFTDKTGQRRDQSSVASFSSAVTQGAEAYLIKSLSEAGDGRWFRVIERVGLDNLVKERQLIRQMREIYQGQNAQQMSPLLFAGIIIEGGIIGYDSNTQTGGAGARWLGIGASTQWRQDTVTINLRAVSVASGEVLTNITVTKTVVSYQDDAGVLKFLDGGTRALESEIGAAINESRNRAIQVAIEAGVVQLIREGAAKGHWEFSGQTSNGVSR
jgi:curli production assembly/transport component CsgG